MGVLNRLKVLAVTTVFLAGLALGLPADAAAPDNGATVYLVRQGDCLSKIAQNYGTTVEELVRLNRLPDQNMLSIGQPILIEVIGRQALVGKQKPVKTPAVEIFVEKEPVDPDYLKIKDLNKKLNDNIQTAQYRQALEMAEQILASVTKFKEKLKEVVAIPVEEEDESYTTWESVRLQKEEGAQAKEDALAAMIIVKQYLERLS